MPEHAEAHDQPLLTAAKLLEWRHRRANLAPPRLPEAAVLTHQRALLPRRLPWRRDASDALLSFDLRRLPREAAVLAGVRGVGAPATAIAIEELAAVGVRRLVAIDIGGSIDPGTPSGTVVLVETALACDGTSPHYTAERMVRPDEALTRRLAGGLNADGIAFSSGAVLSTDAVYRETPAMLAGAREQGALLVDMETACVLAVANALGVHAAAVLVAADELHDAWRPPAAPASVQAQLRRVLSAVTTALQS